MASLSKAQRDELQAIGKAADRMHDRNKFLFNQSLLLVGVGLAVLINSDLKNFLDLEFIFLIKASVVFFLVCPLLWLYLIGQATTMMKFNPKL